MRRSLAFGFLALLTGCPTSSPPTPLPSTAPELPERGLVPDATVLPSPTAETLRGGTSLVNRQLSLRILSATGSPVSPGTRVELSGPSLGRGSTDTSGAIAFGWLEPGTYVVRVEASGSAILEQPVEIGSAPVARDLRLEDPGRSLRGRLLGPDGPLAGSWVACGPVGGWTDGTGRFQLERVTSGTASIVLHRGGLVDRTVSIPADGDRDLGDLTLSGEARRVSWENPDSPVRLNARGTPDTVRQVMASVTSGLTAAGWTVGERLDAAEVRIVVAPSAMTLDTAACARLQTFTRQGGTLVVLGEWGGAGFHGPEAIARLLHPLGIGLVPDLVRVPGGGARLDDFRTAPQVGPFLLAGAPDRSVRVVTSASVWCPARATAVLRAPATGYRIASGHATGPILVAAQPVDRGRVIVTGDTTAWSTGFEGSPGGSWDNQSFIQRLITW